LKVFGRVKKLLGTMSCQANSLRFIMEEEEMIDFWMAWVELQGTPIPFLCLLNISFFDTFCMARGDRLWNFQFVKTRGALVGLDTWGIFGSRDYF